MLHAAAVWVEAAAGRLRDWELEAGSLGRARVQGCSLDLNRLQKSCDINQSIRHDLFHSRLGARLFNHSPDRIAAQLVAQTQALPRPFHHWLSVWVICSICLYACVCVCVFLYKPSVWPVPTGQLTELRAEARLSIWRAKSIKRHKEIKEQREQRIVWLHFGSALCVTLTTATTCLDFKHKNTLMDVYEFNEFLL